MSKTVFLKTLRTCLSSILTIALLGSVVVAMIMTGIIFDKVAYFEPIPENLRIQGAIALATILVIFLLTVIATLAGLKQVSKLRNYFNHIASHLKEITAGNYPADLDKISDDSLDDIGSNLMRLGNFLNGQEKEREERINTKEKLMGLLVDISAMGHGDLSVRADVTEDTKGAIAQSFNTLAENFSEVISKARVTCENVKNISEDTIALNNILIDQNLEQAKNATTATQIIKNCINFEKESQAGEENPPTAEVPEEMTLVQEGSDITCKGIRMTELQVKEACNSLAHLRENFTELQKISELLQDFSDRMGIVALNGSIQATMAEGIDHGFGEISEELQRLSGSSKDAAKKIEFAVQDHNTDLDDLEGSISKSAEAVASCKQYSLKLAKAVKSLKSVSSGANKTKRPPLNTTTDQEKRLQSLLDSLEIISSTCRQSALNGTKTINLNENLTSAINALHLETKDFIITGEKDGAT